MTTTTSETTRPFWQPRLWVFWVYLALTAFGFALIVDEATDPVLAMPGLTALVVLATVLLGLVITFVVRRIDLFRATPTPLLVAGFLWGAFVAAGIAGFANGHIEELLADWYGAPFGEKWTPPIAGASTEEWLKTLGVVTIVLIGRPFVRRPMQGFVLGACTGLGFQLLENITYAWNSALNSVDTDSAGFVTLGVRTLMAGTSHWVYSAICGLGVGYALTRRDRSFSRRSAVAVSLFALSWGLHFMWNADAPGSPAVVTAQVVVKVAAAVIVVVLVYRRAMRSEWRWFTSTAAAERDGIITSEEAVSLRTRRLRRKARKGLRGEEKKRMRRLQRAQLRLVPMVGFDEASAEKYRAQIWYLKALPRNEVPSSAATA
ncbi:hypothetical protein UK23_14715 [Lentzea aerocolonigenes]|uniref:Peptidase n=1 Tax=Lentzea aerocolonigenes TaxID=68170 RepID=A0A0F0H0I8_LENAE|nr:PrsW family intramembrane metalloprotease [Lentzea aerocolonigenes]KJK49229.1 hypothetical protein UK23_14715 [Lentzea aerocolonigenes]